MMQLTNPPFGRLSIQLSQVESTRRNDIQFFVDFRMGKRINSFVSFFNIFLLPLFLKFCDIPKKCSLKKILVVWNLKI